MRMYSPILSDHRAHLLQKSMASMVVIGTELRMLGTEHYRLTLGVKTGLGVR